jgi:hypothetical protein
MKRAPAQSKESKPPREKPAVSLAEWWRLMAKYEGQFPQKRPDWLEVP